jgi:N-acetylmuramic acid 6-phosphate etherase
MLALFLCSSLRIFLSILKGAAPAVGFAPPIASRSRLRHDERSMNPANAHLALLPTEARNPASEQIDRLSTLEMLTVINREDQTVALAVERELPRIARAVDAIAERFERGGRLFYIGAGTSGRLGVLDASECPPTFSVSPTLVQGLIAGGDSALRKSSEHSEDSPAQGAADLAAHDLTPEDTLVGIAASGRTPYVLGALEFARSRGVLTIALACVPDSELAQVAELAIEPVTGPEILTGSTRMKAGTATKLVLNMLSTGVMIRTGAVYGNLMVNMRPSNEKLVDRSQRILMAATGCDRETAVTLLETAGDLKTAIVMQRLGLDQTAAAARLEAARGRLSAALAAV